MTPTARRRPHPRIALPTLGLASVLAALAASAAVRAADPAAGAAGSDAPAPAPVTAITANGRLAVGAATSPAAAEPPPAPDSSEDRRRAHGQRPLGPAPAPANSIGAAADAHAADAGAVAADAGAVADDAGAAVPGLPGSGPPGAGGGAWELLKTGGALGAVLAIAVVLSRFVRRLGGMAGAGRPAGVLEILARYPVGRGQQLVVLRLDRRILLVHQAGGRMEPLTEVTDRDEVARLLGRLEAGASGGDAERFRRTLAELEHGRGPEILRPDGTLPGESRGVRRAAMLAADDRSADAARPSTGLAAALRAGRRAAAYGAARGSAAAAPAPAAVGLPEIEVVDLTRRGRGGRR